MTSVEDPDDIAAKQALLNRLNEMKEQSQTIAQKIAELDQERHEHSLVLDTLGGLAGDRKCFRMIGTVLTERTVGDVKPQVEENMNKLAKVVEELTATLQTKEKEMQDFQAKHNIRFQKKGAAGGAPQQAGVRA